MQISVKSDIKAAQKKFKQLGKTGINKAASQALNETIKGINTDLKKVLAKEMGVAQNTFSKDITIRKAYPANLVAVLTGRGKPYNVIRFKARETKSGLTAKPWGKSRKWKTGFIGNSGRTAFYRMGKERLPIKAIWGPGLANEMRRPYSVRAVEMSKAVRFPKAFDRAIANQIRRMGG